MKSQISYFQFWVLVVCLGIISQAKDHECYFQQSFDSAFENSQAVFLGNAIEEKSTSLSMKGGGDLSYKEVKFEVEKSWKLINKQFVWVRIPARRSDNCGYIGINLKYLVYANQTNDILFISPASRTMSMSEAKQDLENLGEEKLEIFAGEFRVLSFQIWAILIAVGVLLVSGVFLYLVSKRSITRF